MQAHELSADARLALDAFRSPATYSVTMWATIAGDRYRIEIACGPGDPGEERFQWNVWHADNWHVTPDYSSSDLKAYVSPEEALQDCQGFLADEPTDDPLGPPDPLIPRRHALRALFDERGPS